MSMTIDMDLLPAPPTMLKALAEPLRWRIVTALAVEELCVCHLTEDLDVPQPLISHHLRVLRDVGIVESEKWRYWTYYRLRPAASRRARQGPEDARERAERPESNAGRVADATGPRTPRRGGVRRHRDARHRRGRLGDRRERLSPGDVGLQLLQNAAATAAALIAIILAVGPVSGAHLNPVVSLADAFFGGLDRRELAAYIPAQIAGGIGGAILANLMFSLPAVEWSTKSRSGGGLWLAEAVATAGLLFVVFGIVRSGRTSVAPFAVGAYIGAAYWFTSSTSFANPAVTIARAFSDTFAGIMPSSVPAFVVFQLVGAAFAVALVRYLYPDVGAVADDVIVPAADATARVTDERARGKVGG